MARDISGESTSRFAMVGDLWTCAWASADGFAVGVGVAVPRGCGGLTVDDVASRPGSCGTGAGCW